MEKNQRNKSIAREITLYISAFAAFICIIIGGTSIFMSRSSMIKQAESSLTTINELGAEKVKIVIDDRLLILQELAHSARTQTMDFSVQQESLKGDVERLGYLDMAIVNLKGEAHYILDNHTADLSDREYVKRALDGEANVSDVLISKVTNSAVLMYAVPIEVDNKVVGALIARRDGNALFDVIDQIVYGETGYTYILNTHGIVVAHPNRDYVMNQFTPIEDAKTDPDAAAKLTDQRSRRNANAKQKRDALIAQAETDPEAAAKLADKRARDLEATQRYYANMQEQAKTDPDVAAKWEAHKEYNRRYLRNYHAKKKAASDGKEQEIYDVCP